MGAITVAELWRYPVKSMQGEQVTAADVTPAGLAGDRHWGLLDRATGLTLTARRVPELLFGRATLTADGDVRVELPDGTDAADDAALSDWLGRDVTLRRAGADVAGTFEIAVDAEDESGSEWITWTGPTGTFHDSGRTRVSLVGAATLGRWDRRRFRANIVLAGTGPGEEDAFVGSTVTVGTVTLEAVKQIDRCVMTTRPQPGGIDRDLDVLRTIARQRGNNLGVATLVVAPGRVAVGDAVTVAAG